MRRPRPKREVSDRGTALGHRGSGEGMRAKDWRVNTGDPSSCVGESSRNRRSVRTRAGRAGKSERPIRALKRVTIAEQRGLGSRVRSEGARARAIGVSLATSIKRSAAPEALRCLSEPGHALWVPWVGDRINHLVRKPNAGQLHVRFDERDLETEAGSIPQTPATERAGQQVMIAPTPTAPDLDSTRSHSHQAFQRPR